MSAVRTPKSLSCVGVHDRCRKRRFATSVRWGTPSAVVPEGKVGEGEPEIVPLPRYAPVPTVPNVTSSHPVPRTRLTKQDPVNRSSWDS